MALQLFSCGSITKCDGKPFNPATDTVVDCASLTDLVADEASTIVCDLLSAISESGGEATVATQLVGADCKLYTIPAAPVDITVQNLEIIGDDIVLTEDDGTTHTITSSQLLAALGLVDCDGTALTPGTALVTCDDTETFLSEDDLIDCEGKPFALKKGFASCEDITLLQDQITEIMTLLGTFEEVQDCEGNGLGYQVLPV